MSGQAESRRPLSGKHRVAAAGLFLCVAAAGFFAAARLYKNQAAGQEDGVWLRLKVDSPGDLRYVAVVDCETDPYKPARKAVGTLNSKGLAVPDWLTPDGNDWPRPLPFVKPTTDNEWLSPGTFTAWAKLPRSSKAQWHCAAILRRPGRAKDQAFSADVTLQFATAPSERSVFKRVAERTNERAAVSFLMPTKKGPEGLKMVKTFREWAQERRTLVKSVLNGEPPKLNKLKVRTWVNFQAYRKGGGSLGKDIAELDFQNLRDMGINGVSAGALSDEVLGELASKYGIRGYLLKSWANGLGGFIRQGKGKYDLQPGESFEARLARIFDDLYAKRADDLQKKSPNVYALTDHVVLGDEITGAVRPDRIENDPFLLGYFRQWLRGQGLSPSDLGYASWDQVKPAFDRERLNSSQFSLTYAKNFYYTRRFIDHYTAVYYRSATNAVEKYIPQAEIIAANYQAGPMQFGFIGSDNNLDRGQLDIFELGRQSAFKGAMTEDWVKGWDLGIGRELFGAAVMRASARKHDLPVADYVVGGEALRSEMMAMASQGIKELNLYLYGPVSNIGIAWADDPEAIRQTADAVRLLSRFEDDLANAKPQPAKAAMLVSTAYDIMQTGGRAIIPERQDLFVTLAQSQVPVDIVSEGEVLGDDILKDYKVLYVVDPQVPEAVQRRIDSWVRSGGTLWASAGALRFDEFGRPANILDKTFGVSDRKTVEQEGGITSAAPPWTSKVNRFDLQQIDDLRFSGGSYFGAVSIPVRGMKLSAKPTTARVLGTYSDGSPAAFGNDYGNGKTVLIGALVGSAYLNEHYPGDPSGNKKLGESWEPSLGSEAALAAVATADQVGARSVKLSVQGVYSSVLVSGNTRLLFLINATGRPLGDLRVETGLPGSRPVSARGVKISSDGKGAFSLPLADCDVILLKAGR